jgi:hypothetical protein
LWIDLNSVCFCLAHHHHHHHPGENLKGKFFKNGFDFLYLRKVRRISLVPFFFFSTCFFVLFFRTSCIYIYPPTRERRERWGVMCWYNPRRLSLHTNTPKEKNTIVFFILFFIFSEPTEGDVVYNLHHLDGRGEKKK